MGLTRCFSAKKDKKHQYYADVFTIMKEIFKKCVTYSDAWSS